jgi:hypothetical protein
MFSRDGKHRASTTDAAEGNVVAVGVTGDWIAIFPH